MEDLKKAMKEKNDAAKRGIRAIKQAILMAKTDGSGASIGPDEEIKMLQKLAKQRKESIEIYEQQGRDDLANTEKEELEVIQSYLPEQMSEEQLKQELRAMINELGINGKAEMGKLMGTAMKRLAGKADGKAISAAAKELLD